MTFDERKTAFENKYAHDQELLFKIEARTCKLFGLWAADQLGLAGDEAETYARDVIAANLEEAGFDDVKRKVLADFKDKGKEISEHLLDRQIEACYEDAKNQIVSK